MMSTFRLHVPAALVVFSCMLLLSVRCASSFHYPAVSSSSSVTSCRTFRPAAYLPSSFLLLKATPNNEDDDVVVQEDMNPLTRASWFGVEIFGKVFGAKGGEKSGDKGAVDDIDLMQPPKSLEEALQRIELDNEREYFLSGEVDVFAYDEDCVFSDPFVSFRGRQRFVDNLANLGSFITEYDARMLGYDVSDDGTSVKTKVMVKLELNLPWKPVLAWPWGVTYDIDPETYLITNHAENWDVRPIEGVKQIFRKPSVKICKKKRS